MATSTPWHLCGCIDLKFGISGQVAFVRSSQNCNFVCYRKRGFYQDPRLSCKNRFQSFEMSGILFLIKKTVNCPRMRLLVQGEKLCFDFSVTKEKYLP